MLFDVGCVVWGVWGILSVSYVGLVTEGDGEETLPVLEEVILDFLIVDVARTSEAYHLSKQFLNHLVIKIF